MIKRIIITFTYILIFTLPIHAQQEYQEQLDKLDYKILYSNFEKHYKNSDFFQAKKYANAYYYKAQKQEDTINIGKGYYYRAILYKKSERLDLYDSIIALSPGLKKSNFLTKAHLQKAYYYYYKLQYNKALENYIKASEYNTGDNKEELALDINLSIAQLKIRIEENQEALDTLRKYWKKITPLDYKERKPITYNRILLHLANAYRKMNYVDSSNVYASLGIRANDNQNKENNYYYYFLLLQAINELNDTYTLAPTAKMNEGIAYMKRIDYKESISLAYYNIGKSHQDNNNMELAVTYFLKVDSLIDNSASILPETFEGYKFLKNYYEEKGDTKNELKYLKKIYAFDSILDTNYKSINNTIKTKYELPILLENHKSTIDALDSKNQKSKKIILISFSILGMVVLFLMYSLIQKNKYKKRFQQLQENNFSRKAKEKNKKPQEKPSIPDEIFTKTEAYLKEFEKKQQFLIQSMNSEKLAQQIGTNRPYFSKAFNYLKNESFNVYLRNLRLEYALERLREDATFRKYTIKTIANESGFSNAESFSKYFYKKYGIYPSYYIKSIEHMKKK